MDSVGDDGGRNRRRPEDTSVLRVTGIPEFLGDEGERERQKERERGSEIDRVNSSRTIHSEVPSRPGSLPANLPSSSSVGAKLQTDLKIGRTAVELALLST